MSLVVCPHCDQIQRMPALPQFGKALCGRCGAELYVATRHSIDHALALALGAAILCLFANVFPLMTLSLQGVEIETTIFGTARALYLQDRVVLSALVLWVAMIAPVLLLSVMLYVLVPMRLGFVSKGFSLAMRWVHALRSWVMVEVFMLAVFVALVKLDKVGAAFAGPGAWLCLAWMLVLAGLSVGFDTRMVWRVHDALLGRSAEAPDAGALARGELALCEQCGLLAGAGRCSRCGARIHSRRPASASRCLALLLAALVLYLPANLLTMMESVSPFGVQQDTILSGVVYLWDNGSPDLAVIVFVASIVVPIAKIMALGLLLACVRWRWSVPPRQLARLYRLIELVGKWSMLDLFVIGLLAALVDFGTKASVQAGPASLAFGAVVVLTMLAASSFDPRLIWDAQENRKHE